MAGLLQEFVQKEIENEVRKKYPHMQHPPGMYAEVVRAEENGGKHVCTLRVLDRGMNIDSSFPEIPNVKTDIDLKKGDTAVILFLYGGSAAFVLGRIET